MTPLLLLALMAGLAIPLVGDDDDDLDDTPDPQDPDDPDIMPDTGASFLLTDDGVELELGEDETGSLAVIYYEDTEDNADQFLEVYEARFYLVPEGIDWSDASWETQDQIPGAEDFVGDSSTYLLEDFESQLGLELLGTVDLLEDPRSTLETITANAPVESYFLTANTDGDELVTFLPEDYIVTREGVPETTVTADTTGSEQTDWLNAGADGITVDGAGGDDILGTSHADVTLIGGLGDDTVVATGTDAVITGGAGDDDIRGNSATVTGGEGNDRINIISGTARGGEGDDRVTAYGDAAALLYGETGDDSLTVSGTASRGFGGAGDDFVGVDNGAIGHGGAGNDHLQLESGTTGVGGAGDDLFTIWNQFRDSDGPATVITGDGADTIDARVWNGGGGEADQIYLQITDFDPAEDVINLGTFQTTGSEVTGYEIIEAPDGSHTDLRVQISSRFSAPGIAVIRLDGTPGLTAQQIVVN